VAVDGVAVAVEGSGGGGGRQGAHGRVQVAALDSTEAIHSVLGSLTIRKICSTKQSYTTGFSQQTSGHYTNLGLAKSY